MSKDDRDYFERRAAQELELARKAATPAATSAHQELSKVYRERARNIAAGNLSEGGPTEAPAPETGRNSALSKA